MHREVGVSDTETGNKIVFKVYDGIFRCIALINMWWYNLIFNGVVVIECFHGIGGFIFEPVYFWLETSAHEMVVYFRVGS